MRAEGANSLPKNFAFLSVHALFNMSTEDHQKNGVLTPSKDLNAFGLELAVFKGLVHEINEKSNACDRQHRFIMLE